VTDPRAPTCLPFGLPEGRLEFEAQGAPSSPAWASCRAPPPTGIQSRPMPPCARRRRDRARERRSAPRAVRGDQHGRFEYEAGRPRTSSTPGCSTTTGDELLRLPRRRAELELQLSSTPAAARGAAPASVGCAHPLVAARSRPPHCFRAMPRSRRRTAFARCRAPGRRTAFARCRAPGRRAAVAGARPCAWIWTGRPPARRRLSRPGGRGAVLHLRRQRASRFRWLIAAKRRTALARVNALGEAIAGDLTIRRWPRASSW